MPPTANRDPNFVYEEPCDHTEDGERCEEVPTGYVGEIYYACEKHFEEMADWLEEPSVASEAP